MLHHSADKKLVGFNQLFYFYDMRNLPYLLLPFCLFFARFHYAGPDPGDALIQGIRHWHDNYPQEKIFVQTDREYYAAGESVWLKSWCTLDNKPSFLSRILYVVLSDATGKVVDKKLYQLDSLASAAGVIDLDKQLRSGNYQLSAYTLWMLNFPDYVFRKTIYVYGPDYKPAAGTAKTAAPAVQFFPEGGDLIEGVRSRLAFKAVLPNGMPLEGKASVYDSKGTKLADAQTEHDGMGVFELEPAAGEAYTARFEFANGQKAELPLPAAKKEGLSLQAQPVGANRISLVLNRGAVNKARYNNVIVIGQVNGVPVYKASFNIDEGEMGASIQKKNLPAGLLQITAFDTLGMPLAERLVFIDNYQAASPDLALQVSSTKKRGRNVITFRLDSLAKTSLSALVLNGNAEAARTHKDNLVSSLLLSSDLKGYIHNPGYYFSERSAEVARHLDLLLMTQGWRRFSWKQVRNQEELALKYPVETFLNIKGKVTKSDRLDPVKSGNVMLIIKAEDSTTIMSNAFLTDKGEFIVDSLSFTNKAVVSYEGNNKKNQVPVDVQIYPAFIDTLKRTATATGRDLDTVNILAGKSALAAHLKGRVAVIDRKDPSLLETVTVRAKKLSRTDSLQREYVSPMYQMSDQTLDIPEKAHYVKIWQFLNQNVPGFNVNPFQVGGVTYASFARYDGLSLTDSEQPIKFLLNEVPVAIDVIDALNPEDVALVKVYKGAMGFALGAEAGAISIYTKKGANTRGAIYDKSFARMDKQGYAYVREFYSPNYKLHPELNAGGEDNRLVLYWNPKLKRSAGGEYTVEFFNDDKASSFKLVIQGIDSNGKLVYKEQLIQ